MVHGFCVFGLSLSTLMQKIVKHVLEWAIAACSLSFT